MSRQIAILVASLTDTKDAVVLVERDEVQRHGDRRNLSGMAVVLRSLLVRDLTPSVATASETST